jgi:signal peptidase I
MINLTSIDGLVHSLISEVLGDKVFNFFVYLPDGGGVENGSGLILEFFSTDYKFTISKKDGDLRIYDNGKIYLVKNFLPENYVEEFSEIMHSQAFKLFRYYTLFYVENRHTETKENTYKFMKLDLS